MKDKKRIVIAGGGILGVEAAEALNKIGGNITIVERGSCIVKAQLNEKFSSMLKKALENQGVKVLLNATVKQIQKDKIVLDNNQEIPADFMIVSMGVRGNLELAKQASLDINKSIVIDDFMRTSYKNIFSAGDCAEYKGKPGGLWIISSAQGKCAGANMAGDKSQYSVVPFATAFIGVGVKFFAVGNVHLDDIKEVKKKENYTLLSFENNILKGGILWGDTSKSNALMDLLANNANKDTAIKELL